MPAQKNVLKVRSDDDAPITIAINDRYYEKVAREITIGDLPAGRHQLKVYEYKAYRDEQGGKAKLLFSGSVKVRRDAITTCVVNPAGGEMFVQSKRFDDAVPDGKDGINKADVRRLQDKVKDAETDTERLKLMQASLSKLNYTTAQVAGMMQWLDFDDSRLQFAKWAYSNTVDKTRYADLEKEFTMQSNRDEFRQFLKQY